MNAKKLNYLLIAGTIVLGLCFFVSGIVANTILTHKSAELSKLKAESEVTLDQQDTIKKDKADIAKYSELNEIAKAVVPQDKNQAQTVNEVVRIASASGIPNISSITFPASTLGGTGKTVNGMTQVTTSGISGVYLLPITITQNSSDAVPYSHFITFLQKLENNRRTAQVSAISIQPDSKNSNNVSFTLTVNEYIKP